MYKLASIGWLWHQLSGYHWSVAACLHILDKHPCMCDCVLLILAHFASHQNCVCVFVCVTHTSTLPISIGHSPTPKRHLQSRGLGPATLSNRQRLHSQHQWTIKRSHLSGFRACLPSSGRHTDKYLTNDNHIRHLYIRRISWLLRWALPLIMSHTVKPHNPQITTVRLPPRRLFLLIQTIQPEGTLCDGWGVK